MGGHNGGHTCGRQGGKRTQVVRLQFVQAARVVRQGQMAVAADEAVAGKMFAAGFHAAAFQAAL